MFLSKANKVIHYTIFSTGRITGTIIEIQIILSHAILLNVNSMVLSHNHPSGNLKPADADINTTKRLKEAGNIMDLTVLDYIILSKMSYYSFADNGII